MRNIKAYDKKRTILDIVGKGGREDIIKTVPGTLMIDSYPNPPSGRQNNYYFVPEWDGKTHNPVRISVRGTRRVRMYGYHGGNGRQILRICVSAEDLMDTQRTQREKENAARWIPR